MAITNLKYCLIFFQMVLLLIGSSGCSRKTSVEQITVLGEDSSNIAAIEKITETFEKENNVKVVFRKVSFDEALKEANQDLAIGNGKYDIILQYNFTLASYVEGKYIWQLDELKQLYGDISTNFEGSLFDNAWKETGYYYKPETKEAITAFGYPFAANTLLLVFNKELFADANRQREFQARFGHSLAVPKSWKEFAEVAKFFTDQQRGNCGVTLQGASGGWLYYEFTSMMASEGLSVFEKKYGWERAIDKVPALDTAGVLDMAKFYVSMRPFNCGDFLKTDAVVQRQLMLSGKVAMALMWSDYIYDLAYKNGKINNQFGFAVLPGNASPLAGGSYYINKHSRHVHTAYRYLTWLMSDENQEKMLRLGLVSPSRKAYTKQIGHDVPYAEALKASIERGVYAFEANRDSDIVQEEVTKALQSAWEKPAKTDSFLSEANQEIREKRKFIFK